MPWKKMAAAMFYAALAMPALSWADPLDARQIPADAKWVVHIDMDAARDTKTWDAIYTKLVNNDEFQTKVGQIEQLMNGHFPRDMRDLTLYGRAAGDEAAVIILHAKMDRNQTLGFLQLMNTYQENAYGDYKVISWEDKGKRLFASFHDDSTVLVGRLEANIQAALDTIDGKGESIKDGPLASGIKPQLLVYVAAQDLADLKKPNEPQSPVVKEIKSGWICLSEKDGNDIVQANFLTENADTADQLHSAMSGIKAMVSMAGNGDNADPKAQAAAKALKSFTATQTDKVVTVEWPIPLEQVTDFISKLPLDGQSAEH